ncbi:mediator of RNA polymerase II transcription subunit 6 [Egretta garzetta]|nr:mediator of RNA polymerase II transcription subunit 6 [Egretta garzetta]
MGSAAGPAGGGCANSVPSEEPPACWATRCGPRCEDDRAASSVRAPQLLNGTLREQLKKRVLAPKYGGEWDTLARLGLAWDQSSELDNLLGISWVDSSWIPILNNGSVLDYFSERSNPFYDRTCNNEVVKMQRMTLEHLNQMVGVEYILLHAQEPILFIIRKQQRQSPTQVIPLADYYIIAGVIYQAPDLGSVINSRVLTAVHGIQSAFEEAMSYCRYHPSKGYWWHFKDQEEREKAKPKAKKKEEPSSIFQRQRVDALLLDLRQKFPPRFVQQKPGEKPIPVDQIKKEPEPAPEAVKTEEKETVKNAQQSAGTKGPPEKRMRLQ